jgi:hypothetical protein
MDDGCIALKHAPPLLARVRETHGQKCPSAAEVAFEVQ